MKNGQKNPCFHLFLSLGRGKNRVLLLWIRTGYPGADDLRSIEIFNMNPSEIKLTIMAVPP